MNKKKYRLSRRGTVRTISFIAVLVTVLAVSSAVSFAAAQRYRTYIEYTYQRALSELADYIGNIDSALEKGKYASTAPQIQKLSIQLWQEAAGAKAAIAQLPADNSELSATTKFLSQLGNYCMSLSQRVSQGDAITAEEEETLVLMAGYAGKMSEQLQKMLADADVSGIAIGGTDRVLNTADSSGSSPAVTSGFRQVEDNFTNYPVMVYDGPFSDHIQQQKSKLLEGKPEVDVTAALQTAEGVTGSKLERTGDMEGNLPCYRFSGTDNTLTVTKAGGIVESIYTYRTVGEPAISGERALEIAADFLKSMGIHEFANRYYEISDGVLTANFTATQNGVVLYPDLISVGIALDTGTMYSYNARGYILNHIPRLMEGVGITEDEARAVLSKRLTPRTHSLAIIPGDGLTEILCHEFLCDGIDGDQVLVYINAATGAEEQIMLMLVNEGGVLAM